MKAVEFVVTGDPAQSRDLAAEILAADGFTMNWLSDWTADAVRGSTTANVLLGGLAQRFKVGLSVTSVPPGQSVVRFDRQNSGLMGGAIGMVRTNNNMKRLKDQFGQAVQARGVLVEVRET